MPRYIVEIRNPENDSDRRLLEWSTVSDAPNTHGMTPSGFVNWYVAEYGASSRRELVARLQRVAAAGTSEGGAKDWTDTVTVNRAGPRESRLPTAKLWAMCVPPDSTVGPGDTLAAAIESLRTGLGC
jgi:hypothetical protein